MQTYQVGVRNTLDYMCSEQSNSRCHSRGALLWAISHEKRRALA